MQDDFYCNKLYPLQDKVLEILSDLDVDFYLTGGTALSRAFIHHRYSDDLDFFVNRSSFFSQHFDIVFNALQDCNIVLGTKSESYARCFVKEEDVTLKLDFVNDVPYRRGQVQKTNLYIRTDTILNILSNKISALSRNEPKDFADILEICNKVSFNWIDLINDAKKKDMDVDELDVAKYLCEFNIERLLTVNWINKPNIELFKTNINAIVQDIFKGSDNSIFDSINA